jgi:anion-transporting  ArsA/GET3 family ATPase
MSALFEGFEQRIQRVYDLLRSPATAFVLVTSPEEQVLSEAEYFCKKVRELSVSLRAVVFNRLQREAVAEYRSFDEAWLRRLLAKTLKNAELGDRVAANFLRYETQARGDQLRVENFRRQLPAKTAVAMVPNFEEDLHDLDGLGRMIPYLS